MYKLKGNYTVGTKGLCSTDFLINFIWFLQGKFCSNCSKRKLPLFTGFPLYLMHDSIYTESTEALVALKLSIDCQKRSKYAILWIFPQLIDSSLKHYFKEIA